MQNLYWENMPVHPYCQYDNQRRLARNVLYIPHKYFFNLTSFSMSEEILKALRQGVYLTFVAVHTNVRILPMNNIEFCCLKYRSVRHNLQLTNNSGQIHFIRAWN
jgi:hypothetical protein